MLGISADEIKNKLNENYSFNDIDKICESLQEYQIHVSKLPFNVAKKSVKMKITESKNEPLKQNSMVDDEIDEQLLRIANI